MPQSSGWSMRSLGFCDKGQTYVVASGTVVNLVKYCDVVRVDLLLKNRHYLAMLLRHLQYGSCVTLEQVKYKTGNHFARYCRGKILLYYLGGYRKQFFS
jgi:hypothetical protein